MTDELWYRYDAVRYAPPLDEYDRICGSGRLEVRLHKFPVLRHTPKGVWLDFYSIPKFVLNDSRKKFACATLEDARASFIARKTRQIRIYEARLADAEAALAEVSTFA